MKRNLVSHVLRGLTMMALIVAMFVPFTTVEAVNDAVNKDRNGVIQVKVVYEDDEHKVHDIQSGTGFLINEQDLITSLSNLQLSDDMINLMINSIAQGKTSRDVLERLRYRVTVWGDNTYSATKLTDSSQLDFAVLHLEAPIQNREILRLADSDTVLQTDDVYALGFPDVVAFDGTRETIRTYNSDDVTISDGRVNKITVMTDEGTNQSTQYILASAKTSSSYSGGPLVNSEGAVIGMIKGIVADESLGDLTRAVSINQITNILDLRGIIYYPDGDHPTPVPTQETVTPTPEPEPVNYAELESAISVAKEVKTRDYTDNTLIEAFNNALENAEKARTSESQFAVNTATKNLVDSTNELKDSKPILPQWVIFAIIGIIVLAVLTTVLIITRKKKAPVTPTPISGMGGYEPYNAHPVNPQTPYQGGAGTTVLNNDAAATTVLGGNAAETTVLNANTYGQLIRNKNGETVNITKDHFRIGRERNKVDYCITDNTNVGRTHAEIISDNGTTYIVDRHSTNSTFVNGGRITPNQQYELHDGDKVSFADEEYTFKL